MEYKKEESGCEYCEYSVYTGDGEFYCTKMARSVIEDFSRTDDYQGCKEENIDDK